MKHAELFLACDRLVTEQGMTIYWRKVKGHSRTLGPDKEGNDEADRLAKIGAVDGTPWEFEREWLPKTLACSVNAITRRKAREDRENPQPGPGTLNLGRQPGDTDLVAMQEQDPAIQAIRQLLGASLLPGTAPPALPDARDLKAMTQVKHHLRLEKGLLVYALGGSGYPRWVVPTNHRGVMLLHAHDAPSGGHRSYKSTFRTLQQVAYWPFMLKDTKAYVKGCLVCCRFCPVRPLTRAPLQVKGITFPGQTCR